MRMVGFHITYMVRPNVIGAVIKKVLMLDWKRLLKNGRKMLIGLSVHWEHCFPLVSNVELSGGGTNDQEK